MTTPRHSRFNEEFLGYIDRRELRYARCRRTGAALGYTARPKADDYEWVAATGGASLYTFVVYHQSYGSDFSTPYNVAVVELDEGSRLVSTIVIDDSVKLKVGMKLRATFEASGRLVFVPV